MNSDAQRFSVDGSSALQAEQGPSSGKGNVIDFSEAARRFGAPAFPEPVPSDEAAAAPVPWYGEDPLGIRSLLSDAQEGFRSGALAGRPVHRVAGWKIAASTALCMAIGFASIFIAL